MPFDLCHSPGAVEWEEPQGGPGRQHEGHYTHPCRRAPQGGIPVGGQAGPGFSFFPAGPLRASATREPNQRSLSSRAGWAGSPELVRQILPVSRVGLGPGPLLCHRPNRLPTHRKAGLELLNSVAQSGDDGGREGKQTQTGVPRLSPENGGGPLPLALGLFPAALASGVWKFDLITV